ncbi:MAG: site-specific integrase [Anaerolineae bacterium]|nr:site-specific integrase [Anaerolineae bacterium]
MRSKNCAFDDLNLTARQLTVRRDGAAGSPVYLTEYHHAGAPGLSGRERYGANQPRLSLPQPTGLQDLLRSRIKAAGVRTGIKVYPHRLRHTCAQLLNAGCPITSIQKLLGHRRLNSTFGLRAKSTTRPSRLTTSPP